MKIINESAELMPHTIPVGSLVELDDDCVRLYVVAHHRDCDGTPLYALSWDKDIELYKTERGIKLWGEDVLHGIPEFCLKLIKNPNCE